MKKDIGYAYNPYEQRIISTLMYGFRPLTTLQISNISSVSYNTTKRYLEELHKKGKIMKRKESNKIYWYV